MADRVQIGTVLIQAGLRLPETMNVECERFTEHWRLVNAAGHAGLEEQIRAAGWNFFYLARLASATALGPRGSKTTEKATERLLSSSRSLDFNAVEITGISSGRFLGVPYTTVTAHSRHIQEGWHLADHLERERVRKAAGLMAGNEYGTRSL